MERKSWTLFNYASATLFLLVYHYGGSDVRLAGALLVTASLASQLLVLTKEERWNGTHGLALAYLLVLGAYAAVTLLGAPRSAPVVWTLVAAAAILFLVELIRAWWTVRDPFFKAHRALQREDDWVIEDITPAERVTVYAGHGSKTYHAAGCGALKRAKDVIELTADEAAAYEMEPCKQCKP